MPESGNDVGGESRSTFRLMREATRPAAIGAIVELCIRRESYLDWSVASVGRLFGPPVDLGQYRLVEAKGEVVGFCTWAWLSDGASDHIAATFDDPRPYEWRTGPNLWIIDIVCARRYVAPTVRSLQRDVFARGSEDLLNAELQFGRALRRDAAGVVQRLSIWPVDRRGA